MPGLLGAHALSFSLSRPLANLAHRGGDDPDVYRIGEAVHACTARIVRHRGHVLALDGAIWNRREIEDLTGERPRSRTDAELLIRSLAAYGPEVLDRIDGMFAFSWSCPEGRHVLARDRFGEVPLYWMPDGPGCRWASERKVLPSRAPARLLNPGTLLDLRTLEARRWYEVPDAPAPGTEPLADLLERAVLSRLDPGGPIPCLLSGGLDSSAILSLAARTGREVRAYSVRLESETADLRAARELSVLYGIKLTVVDVPFPSASSLSRVVSVIEMARKPQVEVAAMCLPLARAIAADGFGYVLSGEGADELFGGYAAMAQEFTRAGTDQAWRDVRRARLAGMASGSLVRANLAFASAGVQVRLPFLDRRLVEAALALGRDQCPPGKGALKRATAGIVPDWIRARPRASFQQGSGMTRAAETAILRPEALFARTCIELYGSAAP